MLMVLKAFAPDSIFGQYQPSEAEPDEAKHGQDLQQNGGDMAAAMLLISRVGWSFGEQQVFID